MIPDVSSATNTLLGILRESGDDPHGRDPLMMEEAYSPRERG